jgi:hypothetical protein
MQIAEVATPIVTAGFTRYPEMLQGLVTPGTSLAFRFDAIS